MTFHLGEVFYRLSKMPTFTEGIRRAPRRKFTLTQKETQLALKNTLRYIPEKWHERLASELLCLQ